ncbi:MAG: tRNA guanosine(34) transglycosylase Tgt [Clostridiales bacterium]|nr:tRNA guanosine(34) transglycosylase Tgt [Clostridiales bacterium]
MYELIATEGRAKRGRFHTRHGVVETPVFMNVGTAAAIKGGLSAEDLKTIKCQVELSNAYHLHLRPGDDVVRELGGIRGFMAWDGPVLTDSGGFQVFSLAAARAIKEEGVYFSSHIDGRKIFIGPEESVMIQSNLASTIAMAFDECAPFPSSREYMRNSVDRTTRWLKRCKAKMTELNAERDEKQMIFAINQGGVYSDIRVEHAKEITELDMDGYAIGGLAVGETHDEMYRVLEEVVPWLILEKPTYLMGVGVPENLLECVSRGVDFFDCVLPARNGRHAKVYTNSGALNLLNRAYERDDAPIAEDCLCPVCRKHTRAYIRHLFKAKEILGMRLCVLHNLYYFNNMMEEIRIALEGGFFERYKRDRLSGLTEKSIKS